MAKRKRGGVDHHAGGGMERWLLTYADMITLLLALFIVLFAMSTLDVVRFEALRRTLAQTFRGQVLTEPGSIIDGARSPLNPNAASSNSASSVTQLQREAALNIGQAMVNTEARLRKKARASGLRASDVEVATTQRGIVVRLAGDTFFASGSAVIRPELRSKLERIATELRRERRPMSIEGHTDGQPVVGGAWRHNQHLSQARAMAVWDFLVAHGIPQSRMHTEGWGATRPLVQPQSAMDPMPKNRRVEIVLLAPGANASRTADDGSMHVPVIEQDSTPAARPIGEVIQPIVVISSS